MRYSRYSLCLFALFLLVSCDTVWADQLVRFKKMATTACEKKNFHQFSKLFCAPSQPSISSGYFTRSNVSLTAVKLESHKPDIFPEIDYQYLLMICFEPINTKEMCELYPVVKENGQFCIKNTSR